MPKTHFRDFILDSEGDWPSPDAKPSATRWMPFGELTVRSGTIWMGELALLDIDQGLVADVPKGECLIEAKGMRFGKHRRLAAIRDPRRVDRPGRCLCQTQA